MTKRITGYVTARFTDYWVSRCERCNAMIQTVVRQGRAMHNVRLAEHDAHHDRGRRRRG